MILQLPFFGLVFLGLGIWFWVKKKKPIAVIFIAGGIMAFILFYAVWRIFPEKMPF
jgi:hypothetical protein